MCHSILHRTSLMDNRFEFKENNQLKTEGVSHTDGLPEGAVIYASPEGTAKLYEAFLAEIKMCKQTGRTLGRNIEDFLPYNARISQYTDFSPEIGGHHYYGAYAIDLPNGTVYLYTDWIQLPDAPLYPLVAVVGSVSNAEVQMVLDTYAEQSMKRMKEMLGK